MDQKVTSKLAAFAIIGTSAGYLFHNGWAGLLAFGIALLYVVVQSERV